MQYQSHISEITQAVICEHGYYIKNSTLSLPFHIILNDGNGILSEYEYSLN